MNLNRFLLLFISFAFFGTFLAASAVDVQTVTIGYAEIVDDSRYDEKRAYARIRIKPHDLDARNIELFERDGKRWVRFEIMNPETGMPMSLKRRLNRTVGIVLGGSEKLKDAPL